MPELPDLTVYLDALLFRARLSPLLLTSRMTDEEISYADNETNYCARCQTGGKLLRDRALSRLLKDDWPRSIDEL